MLVKNKNIPFFIKKMRNETAFDLFTLMEKKKSQSSSLAKLESQSSSMTIFTRFNQSSILSYVVQEKYNIRTQTFKTREILDEFSRKFLFVCSRLFHFPESPNRKEVRTYVRTCMIIHMFRFT